MDTSTNTATKPAVPAAEEAFATTIKAALNPARAWEAFLDADMAEPLGAKLGISNRAIFERMGMDMRHAEMLFMAGYVKGSDNALSSIPGAFDAYTQAKDLLAAGENVVPLPPRS